MNKGKELKPFINIGPGYTIKKYLDGRGWSQEDLSQITEISTKQLSNIINDKVRITIDTARLLAKAFECSPEFWINLDTKYRLNSEPDSLKENAAQVKAKIRKFMPVSEILKKGWFNVPNTSEGYESLYEKIWGVNYTNTDAYSEKRYCARQSKENEEFTKFYTITWEKIARLKAQTIKVPQYNSSGLQEIIEKYTDYTYRENGFLDIINDLNNVGIKFIVLPHLSKTYLDGACFWDKKNPVIVYTGRYDRIDNFWFTMAHEIAHVKLHLPEMEDNEGFIDDLNEDKGSDRKEIEADSIAEKMLCVDEIVQKTAPYLGYFTEGKLKHISKDLKIEPSVILGILQHKGLVDYRKLNKYKKKIMHLLPDGIVN